MRGIIFKKYLKSEILFFDQDYINIDFSDYKKITINTKKINIYYVLKVLFNKKIFDILNYKNSYWKKIINDINPKIIISDNVSGEAIKFKKIFPEIKSALYQHSYIYDYEIDIYRKRFNGLKSDLFFVFDERNKKIFSNFIKSQYVISGSLKNNSINLKSIDFKNKLYDILIISEYRKNSDISLKAMQALLNKLNKYILTRSLKIQIALNSSRKEKKSINSNEEIEFFKKYINNFDPINKNSYKLANNSRVILCISSNIGVELLSRKYRVLFIPILKDLNNKYKNPYLEKDQLFCKNSEYEEFESKLDFLLKLDNEQWLKIINSYNKNILFDEGNHIFYKSFYSKMKE